ncbi:MAG: hypothetical protein U1F35_02880 [Steroidobacteraceae bacterium]
MSALLRASSSSDASALRTGEDLRVAVAADGGHVDGRLEQERTVAQGALLFVRFVDQGDGDDHVAAQRTLLDINAERPILDVRSARPPEAEFLLEQWGRRHRHRQ